MIDFDIVRLTKDHKVLAFDCGNKDINDFLLEDAYDYQEGLLAVTYLAVNKSHDDVLSYFCLLNDKLAYFGPLEKVCGYRSTIKTLYCPFIKSKNG